MLPALHGTISRRSALAALLILLAGVASLYWHGRLPLLPDYRGKPLMTVGVWDSQSYLHMAQNLYGDVVSPFSKRWLYPLLARALENTAHLGWENSFLALNLFAFALLAWCIAASLEIILGKPWLALVLLFTPFPLESLQLAYLPDLFHMALTALLFLLLLKDRLIWALVVLFVSFAVRESTLLFCLVCAAAGWRYRRRSLLFGSLLVLVMSTLLTSRFARLGLPNIHKMPDFLYLALKVPYNFLLNFLGVCLWSEVTPIGHPIATWRMPAFLHVTDKQIGIGFDWHFPATTLVVLLTTFGNAPVFLAGFVRRWRAALEAPLAIQLAFFYGTLCYLVGPSLGGWTDRLVGYGWPVFWLALPYLIQNSGLKPSRRHLLQLVAGYLLICWWPRLIGFWRGEHFLICLLGLLVPYLLTAAWLRKRERATAAVEVETQPELRS
jgi:hypothetical protein